MPLTRDFWKRLLGPAANFVGRIAGIGVTLAIVAYVGVGPTTTAIFLAIALCTFLSQSLGGLIEIQAIADLGNNDSSRRSILGASLILGSLTCLLGAIALVLLRMSSELAGEISHFAIPLLITVPLVCCFSAILGISIHDNSWFHPALASGARTIVCIATVVLLLPRWKLDAVVPALMLGEVVRLALMGRSLVSSGQLSSRDMRGYIKRVLVQLPSSCLGSSGPAIDRYICGYLSLGSVALLDLAEKAYRLLALAYTQGILPVFFRHWATARGGLHRKAVMVRASLVAAGLALPVTVAAIVVFPVLAPLVFRHRAVVVASELVRTNAAYLLGLAPYVGGQVIARLLVLERRNHWLNYTAAVQFVVNVVLDFGLGRLFGIRGLAFSTAAVCWVGFVFAFVLAVRLKTGAPAVSRSPALAAP